MLPEVIQQRRGGGRAAGGKSKRAPGDAWGPSVSRLALLQDRESFGSLVLGRLCITGLARRLSVLHELSSLAHATTGLRARERTGRLNILATRSLGVLTTRGLGVLARRRPGAVAARGLGILATGRLGILAARRLGVLATRGLNILATRRLDILTGTGQRARRLDILRAGRL